MEISINTAISSSIWHKRMGHPSKVIMEYLPFVCNKKDCDVNCDSCRMEKQTRFPFSTSTSCTKEIFELIHVDIWGPYKVESLTGARYFITLVDGHSRCT